MNKRDDKPAPQIVWGIKKGARSMPANVPASLSYSRAGSASLCVRHYAAPVVETWEMVAVGIDEALRVIAITKSDDGCKRRRHASVASSKFGVPTGVVTMLMARGDKPLHATDVWVDGDVVYIQFGATT